MAITLPIALQLYFVRDVAEQVYAQPIDESRYKYEREREREIRVSLASIKYIYQTMQLAILYSSMTIM